MEFIEKSGILDTDETVVSEKRVLGKRNRNLFSAQSISKFCQAQVSLRENAEQICEWLFIKV